MKGFVCDNVLNHEVILADGSIVNANKNENADLWVALRGGSNNFVLITRFDLHTFSQGSFLGGQIIYDFSTASQQIEAFSKFNSDPNYDEHATVIQIFGYGSGQFVILNSLQYTTPEFDPPALKPFTSIQPQILNTLRIGSHGEFATNVNGAGNIGLRSIARHQKHKEANSPLTVR